MAASTDPAFERERLREGMAFLGLTADEQQLAQLTAFCGLVRKWNKAVNLVSRQDIDRLVDRHVLDSLSVATLLADVDGPVLDLGSGAGFPGIPLAIVLPGHAFLLCDRMTRRARFLEQVVRNLGLQNVEIAGLDAAELPPERQFSLVLARAVATVEVLWAMVADRLTEDGRLLVFLSTQPDATAELDAPAALPEGVRLRKRELEVAEHARHTIIEAERA